MYYRMRTRKNHEIGYQILDSVTGRDCIQRNRQPGNRIHHLQKQSLLFVGMEFGRGLPVTGDRPDCSIAVIDRLKAVIDLSEKSEVVLL